MRCSSSTSTARPAAAARARRAVGEDARRQRVARLVGELARHVACTRRASAPFERRVNGGRALGDDADPRDRASTRRRVARLVRRALEVGEDDALGHGLGGLLGRHSCPGAMDEGDAGQAPLARRKSARRGDAPQPVGGEVRSRVRRRRARRAAANPRAVHEVDERVRRACPSALRVRGRGRSLRPTPHRGRLVGKVVIFEDRDDEQVGVELGARVGRQPRTRVSVDGLHRVDALRASLPAMDVKSQNRLHSQVARNCSYITPTVRASACSAAVCGLRIDQLSGGMP